MAVVIETEIWEPNRTIYIFIFISCLLSIFYAPINKATANVLDQVSSPSLHGFQRTFLFLYSVSSVMEGLSSVYGEYEWANYGVDKEKMVVSLCVGFTVSLFIGSFLGMLSDLVGHKKLCLLFYMLHLLVGICKRITASPVIWLASICLSLASSVFSFSFESWMVTEHEKLGHRQDSLSDMFWLMTFFESASFIGSQILGNYLINSNASKSIVSTWNGALVLAVIALIFVTRGWKEAPKTSAFKDYRVAFFRHIISDKRICLLSCAQSCVYFAVAAFWILWSPTIVADGRDVSLGLLYPILLGSRMLGSTGFLWFLHGPLSLRPEEYMFYAFVLMGLSLSVVAYDYQDIGVLVTLFSMFHACTGLVLPSLARLRTIYVPNDVRGGMMGLSLVPANAAILFFLLLGGYYRSIENSTIIAFAALGLFSAAGCMYILKKWGKQLHQDRRNL